MSLRIYIDSADIKAIAEALATGYVYGVTTNPTLLHRAGVRADRVPELVRLAVDHGARELHLQVYSANAPSIVREGNMLAQLDPERVVVKVPATAEGYAAAARLARQGLRVTMTAVYTVRQAVLAASVGARYIAVYLGRMRDAGMDALSVVAHMQRMFDAQSAPVQILAASVRDPEETEALAELGVATVTLPPDVLKRLVYSPHTEAAAEAFLQDARAIQ